MEIGAQLYTLREHCKNTTDFAETLRRVADIGYKTVQVSGTCAFDPTWLKEQFQETGLRCVLTHTSPDRLRDDPLGVVEDHKVFDCRYIGIGCATNGLRNGEEDFATLCGIISAAAKPLADNGCYLMHHNHAMEFEKNAEGKTYLDRLTEQYDETLLGFTLDTYWLQTAGLSPAAYIRKLKGRVPCVHLKDMAVRTNQPVMAPVGAGNMDFDAILAACDDAGTSYLLVEQDDCYGADPFTCLKTSYDYLTSRGLK